MKFYGRSDKIGLAYGVLGKTNRKVYRVLIDIYSKRFWFDFKYRRVR